MADTVGSILVGFAVDKLLNEVLIAFRLLKNCSANLLRLQKILERLQPSVRELSSVQDEKDLAGKWLIDLREQLQRSLELVKGYGNIKINILQIYYTSKESLKVYENIQALLKEAAVLQWASELPFRKLWIENKKMWAEMRAGMTALQEELARREGLLITNSPEDFRRTMSQVFAEDFRSEISDESSSSAVPTEVLRAHSACDVQKPNVTFGGEAVADRLINHLLNRDCKKWIGLWGMGGIGKTFTARKVYLDSKVERHFSGGTHWFTVSKDPNHLLQQLSRKTGSRPSVSQLPKNLDAVKSYLKHLLDRGRMLLVLDDVWHKEIIEYLDLIPDSKKNVILVTTRDQEIFRNVMDNLDMFEIPRLSPEDSWQLFAHYAFHARGKMVPPEVERVARNVAEECYNLPLALEVIGSTMGTKQVLPAERALGRTTLTVWEAALKRLRSENYEKNEYKVLYKKLQLSVDSLLEQDFRLQDCFFYFAAFLEDENLQVERLVNIWNAEGLVEEDVNSSLSAEEAGKLLLMCLVAKSMVEVTQSGHCCKIHDVMRDLALLNLKWNFAKEEQIQVSARICLYAPGLKEPKLPEEWTTTPSSAKRLSFRDNELRQFPDPLQFKAPDLQVLILSANENLERLSPTFQNLTNLKVLDLSRTGIKEIPGALLQRLKALVMLDVSWCWQLQEVSDELDSLQSLEVLHLAGCGKLKKLPRVTNLKKLKSYVGEMMKEEDKRDARDGLRCWQSCVPWQSHCGQLRRGIPYLFPSNLRYLVLSQGKKYFFDVSSLCFLEKLAVSEASYPAGIDKLHHLKILLISGCDGDSVSDVSSLGLLEELRMWNVTSFPTGMTELHRLKILSLRDCNEAPIPALGKLPLLEELSMEINRSDCIESYGYEGVFPSLKSLQMWCGPKMEMFVFHPGTMPKIENLIIWMSRREQFPTSITELPSLKRLELHFSSVREEDSLRDDIEFVFRQPHCFPDLEFLSIKGSVGEGRVRKRLELESITWAEHLLERLEQGLLTIDVDKFEN